MKKLLLINPASRIVDTNIQLAIPPLSLAYIAALTPDEWNIKIIDERIEPLDLDIDADLVGITSITTNVSRAYDLSVFFRNRNIPVVLGGMHVSMLPDEALQYCNSVVIGEAEPVWNNVLIDFNNNSLESKYFGNNFPLDSLPFPRRDLLSDKYELSTLQTTRGCPFSCDFCSVSSFYGKTYRHRPIQSVLDEVDTIKEDRFIFVDDNILGSGKKCRDRALSLFKGLVAKKNKKKWATFVSLNVSNDDEILEYAYRSGCRALYIGFESLNYDSLKQMKKKANLRIGIEQYFDKISLIHKHGIAVIGSFILGSDYDDMHVFEQTLQFIKKAGIDSFDLAYLTPLPGTNLYHRMRKENRIIFDNYPKDWDYYNTTNIIIKHDKMNISDIVHGYNYIKRELTKPSQIFFRALKTLFYTKSFETTILLLKINRSIKCDDYYNFLEIRSRR